MIAHALGRRALSHPHSLRLQVTSTVLVLYNSNKYLNSEQPFRSKNKQTKRSRTVGIQVHTVLVQKYQAYGIQEEIIPFLVMLYVVQYSF